MRLPFADGAFDVVTMSYGLRNVNDPRKALKEAAAKLGGRLAIAEPHPRVGADAQAVFLLFLGSVVPALSEAFSSDESAYDYPGESILHGLIRPIWPE